MKGHNTAKLLFLSACHPPYYNGSILGGSSSHSYSSLCRSYALSTCCWLNYVQNEHEQYGCPMQTAAAHRLRPDACLHMHLAALQDSAAAPNVAVQDEQPEEQAVQQPPPNWTLPGNSVVLPGDHSEQGRGAKPGFHHHLQGLLSLLEQPLQIMGLKMSNLLAPQHR